MKIRAHLIVRALDDDVQRKQNFVLDVESTLKTLLEQEDVDRDFLITVDDGGPKVNHDTFCFENHCG